jgi:hypothetical protein
LHSSRAHLHNIICFKKIMSTYVKYMFEKIDIFMNNEKMVMIQKKEDKQDAADDDDGDGDDDDNDADDDDEEEEEEDYENEKKQTKSSRTSVEKFIANHI